MSKMFKYDGIYQRESFDKEYATALLMEMGKTNLLDPTWMEMMMMFRLF